MTPLRFHAPARLLAAVLLMVAWLIATNHCALGLMKPGAGAAGVHARCPACPAPEKQAPDGIRLCCQAIQGVLVQAEVSVESAHVVALELFAICELLAPGAADGAIAPGVFDHGPPHAASFAESVLQRSLLSHAPPFAV